MKRDFLLNILASLVFTVATQLICYPVISQIVDAATYGIVLTTMGIVNACGVALGTSLNNSRIILQPRYDETKSKGDYSLILAASIPICFTVAYLFCWMVGSQGFVESAIEAGLATVILVRQYYSASFRIIINYKKTLLMNVVGGIGYIIGSAIAWLSGIWLFPFVLGEFFSLIYVLTTSHIVHEPLVRTDKFEQAIKSTVNLSSASIVANVMAYMDRFLILFLLGASSVSYFTTASLLGKMVGIIATPIAGVLLSYYAKESKRVTIKVVVKRILLIVIFGIVSYVVILLLSQPILSILYPTLVRESLAYVSIASLASLILVAGNLLQPTTLVTCGSKWQPIMQVVYLVVYLGICIPLSQVWGLLGFCWGCAAANSVRFALMIFLSLRFSNHKNKVCICQEGT